MVTIRINSHEKDIKELDSSWITKVIREYRDQGILVIVTITVKIKNIVDLVFETPGRPSSYVSRPLRVEERELANAWNGYDLNRSDFNIQNLISFIDRLRN